VGMGLRSLSVFERFRYVMIDVALRPLTADKVSALVDPSNIPINGDAEAATVY